MNGFIKKKKVNAEDHLKPLKDACMLVGDIQEYDRAVSALQAPGLPLQRLIYRIRNSTHELCDATESLHVSRTNIWLRVGRMGKTIPGRSK